jgi:hypothetical protein
MAASLHPSRDTRWPSTELLLPSSHWRGQLWARPLVRSCSCLQPECTYRTAIGRSAFETGKLPPTLQLAVARVKEDVFACPLAPP